jgi:hypothetical protein
VDVRSQHKTDAERRRQDEFILRRKMLEEQAPELWRQLRESFQQFSDAYNKQKKDNLLFFADIGDGGFHIRHKHTTGNWLVVERITGHRVNVLIDSVTIDTYQLSVFAVGDGSVTFVASNGVSRTADEIAAASLERFLGIF